TAVDLMALVSSSEAFFLDQSQCFTQAIEHRDWRRVMIGSAALPPVLGDQSHIQIPTLTGQPASFDGGERPLAHRKRRQAGRAAQAFLGTAVTDIDAEPIDANREATERRDGIDHEQRIMSSTHCADVFERLPGSGGSFRMDDGYRLDGPGTNERVLDGVWLDALSPRGLEPNCFPAAAFDDRCQPGAKYTVDAHNDSITRLNQIHNRRLHSGRACSGNSDGKGMFGFEDHPQRGLNIVHHGQKHRVQVAKQRHRKGAQHAGMNQARARTEKEATRGDEFLQGHGVRVKDGSSSGRQYSGLIPLAASWRSLWQGVVTFEGFLAGKRAWYSSGRYGRVPDDCPPSFFFRSLMVA